MLNIVGIEYTDSKPMLLCQDENDKIGFYELPKGVMRFDPIPVSYTHLTLPTNREV